MKPLSKTALKDFLTRFENFKEGEFREIQINSANNIILTFAVQDSARSYDWISIKLEFEGISEASLLDNSKLDYVDMSDGITISNNGTLFAFNINNSTCHLSSSSLKYEEGQF